ncbi:MAG: patatin-like phospholipase family protein [Candidatus Doudnabacteria bacterium]|nr:patatin-like phospholipase family protein [Candidatus Doudnabacteria bacterium]
MKNTSQQTSERPKIGVALSGGSTRSIAHIGVLEVFEEQGIPIDYLTACSSGAIIAGSFACGTMQQLKQDWLEFDRKFLFHLFQINKKGQGIFNLDKAGEFARKYTRGKRFEDVFPRLGFVAVDILTGEPIILAMGDIVKGVAASCSVPALFAPVPWGNKLLVDGGLFSIVPTTQAKTMGAGIVIGVDIAATRYAFSAKFHIFRRGYNFLRNTLPVRTYLALHGALDRLFSNSLNYVLSDEGEWFEPSQLARPGIFGILGRAIDIANERKRVEKNIIPDCDYLISPKVKHLGKLEFKTTQEMYAEGRRAASAAIPDIKKLLADFEWRWKDDNA